MTGKSKAQLIKDKDKEKKRQLVYRASQQQVPYTQADAYSH
jgi:hypothetical protein